MITDRKLPGLYQAADKASLDAQRIYFWGLMLYLLLLIIAAAISFTFSYTSGGALTSTILFLITLAILIALRVKRPDNIWYNGRAVAESVKTRTWRWMMRAEPYEDCENIEIVSKQFINDLKAILDQNLRLAKELPSDAYISAPISNIMREVRLKPVEDRLEIYKTDRVKNQADWYSRKSVFNRKRSKLWFWASVALHATAIFMLLYRIKDPSLSLPVGVIATAASAVLTWLQAKKHNELASSYSLAAHEIVLIKGEALSAKDEKSLSDFVVNTEAAFSREHTQWTARKNE